MYTKTHYRVRKKRCIPSDVSGSCHHCKGLSIPCSLSSGDIREHQFDGYVTNDTVMLHNGFKSLLQYSPRTIPVLPPSRSTGTHSLFEIVPKISSLIPRKSIVAELVDLYFQFIHNTAHTLFHVPSFYLDFEAGTVPELVLLAIMALSSRRAE